jgi:alpha-acetolactate decarboxylase
MSIPQVVVLDGVAYHQGAHGVKVLQGSERTPFMSVTLFNKARSKQVGATVRECTVGLQTVGCASKSRSSAKNAASR